MGAAPADSHYRSSFICRTLGCIFLSSTFIIETKRIFLEAGREKVLLYAAVLFIRQISLMARAARCLLLSFTRATSLSSTLTCAPACSVSTLSNVFFCFLFIDFLYRGSGVHLIVLS